MNTKAKNEMDMIPEGTEIPVVVMTSSPDFDGTLQGTEIPVVDIGDSDIVDNKHTQIF